MIELIVIIIAVAVVVPVSIYLYIRKSNQVIYQELGTELDWYD